MMGNVGRLMIGLLSSGLKVQGLRFLFSQNRDNGTANPSGGPHPVMVVY